MEKSSRSVGVWLLAVILTGFLLQISGAAQGEERKLRRQIELQGVLGDKVLLLIDGERKLRGAGASTEDGVRVIRIRPESVDLEVEGQLRTVRLGGTDAVTSPFKERKSATVSISRDAQGMYATVGSINGLTVNFLVDTGATTISMNSQHARRLGVEYRLQGKPTMVRTASGITQAYLVNLDTVTVGEISLSNVAAVVIQGQFPQQVLLGMSFLGQVEIQRNAGVMHLKKHF